MATSEVDQALEVDDSRPLSFRDLFYAGKYVLREAQEDLLNLFKSPSVSCLSAIKLHKKDLIVDSVRDRAMDTTTPADIRACNLVDELLRVYNSLERSNDTKQVKSFFTHLVTVVRDLDKNISYRLYAELSGKGVQLEIPNISIEDNSVPAAITIIPTVSSLQISMAPEASSTQVTSTLLKEEISYQDKDTQAMVTHTKETSVYQVTTSTSKTNVHQLGCVPQHKSEPVPHRLNEQFPTPPPSTYTDGTSPLGEHDSFRPLPGNTSVQPPLQLQFDDGDSTQLRTPLVEDIGPYHDSTPPPSDNESLPMTESENDDPILDSSLGDSIKSVTSEANTNLYPEEGLRRRSYIPGELVAPSTCRPNHYGSEVNMDAEKLSTEESIAGYPDPSFNNTHPTCSFNNSHNIPLNHHEPSHHHLPLSQPHGQSILTDIISSLTSSTSVCEVHWHGCRIPSIVCVLVTLFLLVFLFCCLVCYCLYSIILHIIFFQKINNN